MKWDTIQAIRVPHQVRNHNHTSNQSTTPCTTPVSKPHSGNPTAWQKIGGKPQSIWPIDHRDLWRSTIVYHLEGAQYIIQSNIMLVILFTEHLALGYQACFKLFFFFFSNASVSQQSLQIAITSSMQPEATFASNLTLSGVGVEVSGAGVGVSGAGVGVSEAVVGVSPACRVN